MSTKMKLKLDKFNNSSITFIPPFALVILLQLVRSVIGI